MYWLAVVFLVGCALTLLYAALIIYYRYGFLKLPGFAGSCAPSVRFSVIIPARDEELHIARCLERVLTQRYPAELYEVIVADDHSTDRTAAIVDELRPSHENLHLVRMSEVPDGQRNSYKKLAIETAIGRAKGDWIVCTDADCDAGPEWLATLNAFIMARDPVFVAAPVSFQHTGSVSSLLQCLDFLSLQGITAASVALGFHSMCNGANLAYRRDAFLAVNGFRDIDHLASGDDLLLMHKIDHRFPGGSAYLLSRSAIVRTLPMPDWGSFLQQRIRWASKSTAYADRRMTAVLGLVYAYNLFLLAFPLLAWWKPVWLIGWGLLILIKCAMELSFLAPVAAFFGQSRLLRSFLWMQPFHILYIVVSGWLGRTGSYLWKGRRVR